ADQEPIKLMGLPLSYEETNLVRQFAQFLRNWWLVELVTWDLPLVQGPLEFVPTGLTQHLLGPNAITSFVPAYYNIPCAQDVRAEVRLEQEQQGLAAGVGNEFPLTELSARDGQPSEWENAFRLWFLELAARQRYEKPPRGLIARLCECFGEMHNV